jgi:hypothetical protein
MNGPCPCVAVGKGNGQAAGDSEHVDRGPSRGVPTTAYVSGVWLLVELRLGPGRGADTARHDLFVLRVVYDKFFTRPKHGSAHDSTFSCCASPSMPLAIRLFVTIQGNNIIIL